MSANTGGSAFPNPARNLVDPYDPGMRERVHNEMLGMTLRDYFAAKALASEVLARAAFNYADAPAMAELAYRYADAMLLERAK